MTRRISPLGHALMAAALLWFPACMRAPAATEADVIAIVIVNGIANCSPKTIPTPPATIH
jgi:hypothetical protein